MNRNPLTNPMTNPMTHPMGTRNGNHNSRYKMAGPRIGAKAVTAVLHATSASRRPRPAPCGGRRRLIQAAAPPATAEVATIPSWTARFPADTVIEMTSAIGPETDAKPRANPWRTLLRRAALLMNMFIF